jgi:molybdenum cofactor cytidylyltransferase
VAAVLAAGESRRMGRSKPLLPWGPTTMLGQTLENVLASRADEVLVVTGFEAPAVEQAADGYGAGVVHNPNYAEGEMISSVQAAIRTLPDLCRALLVVLADQPLIPTTIYDGVIAAFEAGKGEIIAPVYHGRRGHPVLFGRRFFPALVALPAGSAPRELLRDQAGALYLLPVESDTILLDLDRPAQYERYRPLAADEEKDDHP